MSACEAQARKIADQAYQLRKALADLNTPSAQYIRTGESQGREARHHLNKLAREIGHHLDPYLVHAPRGEEEK